MWFDPILAGVGGVVCRNCRLLTVSDKPANRSESSLGHDVARIELGRANQVGEGLACLGLGP
jgi:hypothetical protein